MKVIAFNGSPRRGGNTQTIIEAVLKGAASKGAETRLVNLYELNMQGCIGCEGCKKELGTCVQKDDLSPLLKEMMTYDAIVLGTPIYVYHVTAQLKALIDRFYCYVGYEMDPETGEISDSRIFPAGKKLVIVTSQGGDDLYAPCTDWLTIVANDLLGASSTEFITQHDAWIFKESARDDKDLLTKAESTGASLV